MCQTILSPTEAQKIVPNPNPNPRSFGGPGDDSRLLGGLISQQKATSLNPD